MALEKRRGFKPNRKNLVRIIASKNFTGTIALGFARKIARDARAGARQYSDTGALAASYKARKEDGWITSPAFSGGVSEPGSMVPHAYATAYSSDPAAAPNEFGGRKGRGPREPRRILFNAAIKYNVPRAKGQL